MVGDEALFHRSPLLITGILEDLVGTNAPGVGRAIQVDTCAQLGENEMWRVEA